MLIKITLLKKAFFFLDGLNVKKADGQVEVDLDGKSDSFKATIARSVASGILESDTSVSDIINLMEDEMFKRSLDPVAGLVNTGFTGEEEAKAEIISVEVEETVEDVEEDVEVAVEESGSNEPSVEEIVEQVEESLKQDLSALLTGTNKSVSSKLRKAELSDDERAELLSLEQSGKNRTVVKKLIEA